MKHTLTLIFSLLALTCSAQVGKLFTADQELSSSLINKIVQDRNGMIWIATENGLNRYDGCKFTIYKHDAEDEHSLRHNLVREIFEDSRGNLFVGTYAGIQLYDPATDRFSLPAQRADGSPFEENIATFAELHGGEVLASGTGVYRLTFSDGMLSALPFEMPEGLPTGDVVRMFEDNRRNLWICSRHEIYRLNADRQVKAYRGDDKNMIISDIKQDNRGIIYIGTMGRGMLRYDRHSDAFVQVDGSQHLPIKDLYAAGTEEIYIGTDGEGLKTYSPQTGIISDYTLINNQLPPPTRIAKVHSILKDNVGNYWLAIYQRGVMVVPAIPNNFKYLGDKSADRNLIGSNCITAFCRDHEGTMWVGTDNDGIYGITPDMRRKAHYTQSMNQGTVPPTVMKIYEDSEHGLWVGSFNHGLGRINRNNGEYSCRRDLLDRNGNVVQHVYDLAEDNDKRIWIATMGAGLFWYDLRTGKIHRRIPRDGEYINDWMNCLLYSSDNKLYTGTYDGAFCIDLSSPGMESSRVTEHGDIIFAMYEDRKGTIWMGSTKGLTSLDPTTSERETFIPERNAYDAIYAIQGDDWNNLWISTNNGLLQFNSESRRFVHYYVEDGLQGNEFIKNSSYRDRNGELWFGGMSGATYFNPQEIVNPARKWNIRITDFYLHSRPVRKGMLSGGREIVGGPVFEAEEFSLAHDDNSFTIEFSTVGFCNSEYITYLYSLDDDQWNTLPAGSNRVSFSNLASGRHRFRVQAMDHAVQSNIREITVRIRPAWWETWWARMLYLLVAALLAALAYLSIRHRQATKQKMLEHIHAKQIDEAKLQFFINISHEIRTPLSLITSPVLKLMESDGDPVRQRAYRTVYRNAERILTLVNQLMDMRKIEKGQMLLRFREVDIIGLLGELCQAFEPISSDKRIDLEFRHDGVEAMTLWISPDYFDKIIINILSNAFKFTPDGGKIEVTLAKSGDGADARAKITIADSGIGIEPAELDRIFERFYQAKSNAASLGTGIGLHLTRSLVDLHHGTIKAENNPDGAGCRFIISMPLGNGHLRSEDIDTDAHTPAPGTRPAIPVAAESAEMPKTYAKTRFKVLIAEDDTEIRHYIREELSAEYHVIESNNGKEALENIFKAAPDLVISDVMMPEMDGLELCRKIKQNINLNSIPVILLTARAREADNLEGLETGADAYITKPFNIEILRRTVKNLIQNREQLRNTFGNRQIQAESLKKIEALSPDEQLMKRVMRVINDNIDNPSLSVEMIAREVGISRVHLHRKLKELTNQTTRDYIRNVRLKQAATLLGEKRHTINEIARLTGFSDPNNFATAFKNLYGVSPSAYMNEQHD